MSNIWIEDGLSLKTKTGIGNYTLMIFDLLQNHDFSFVAPRKLFIETINSSLIKRIIYFLWLNIVCPVQMLLSGTRVLWATSIMLPFIKFPGFCYISTIHDIESIKYPAMMNSPKRIYSNLSIKSAILMADIITTVSYTVKQELVELGVNPKKIVTIYNSLNKNFVEEVEKIDQNQDSILARYNISKQKYILCVGSMENKRKNLSVILEAFNNHISNNHKDLKLVIVGLKPKMLCVENSNVIFTGFIEDEELPSLYANSLAYIFPSIYEGFGIPIIEAQYCKTLILVSDIPVFKEIAGDGAIFCDPEPTDIANKINFIINSPDTGMIKDNGIKNVERISNEFIAQSGVLIEKIRNKICSLQCRVNC